jgi:hypothetical protein
MSLLFLTGPNAQGYGGGGGWQAPILTKVPVGIVPE